MRVRMLTVCVLAILWPVAFAHASGQPYYLALGDSLAAGAQPNSTDTGLIVPNPPVGYVTDIFSQLNKQNPSLHLENLGCIGETTASMIAGGICNYGADGSQLRAAIDFVENNQVSLITLDIGANDIDTCISTSGINDSCVFAALVRVGGDLSFILGELRRAAPGVPIIGMNYYDPFLAAWTLGSSGQALAIQSLEVTDLFNSVLDSVYHAFGVPVANVAAAFQVNNFAPGPNNLPENVDLTFALTWIGLAPITPVDVVPNVHPNPAGYGAIAAAFEAKIE